MVAQAYHRPVTSDHRTFCRICAAACGAIVTVDGDQVSAVRGDHDHPGSRGYLCSKGRALGDWHHRSDRLDRPRLHGRTVTWPEVLGDLAAGLGQIRDGDPDRIAMYLATGFAYDSAAQVASATWLAAVGSSSFYSAATVDNAPVLVAAEQVTGHPMANPVWDPQSPGVLVLVGTNPVVSHGYGTTLPDPIRHLREYRAKGGEVWVLDPRRTETAAQADRHLALRPGSDVEVLAWLAGELLTDDVARCRPADVAALRAVLSPFSRERAVEASGLDPAMLDALVAAVRGAPGRVAMMCGTGVTMARDGLLAEWLRWVVLIATDSLDRPGGMRFNRGLVNRLRPPRAGTGSPPGPAARPELGRVAGQLPLVALADEIDAGNVRALVLAGGNPIAAAPQPARMRSALRRLEVLVTIDVLESELTSLATHVLPAAGQLERADLALAEQVSLRSVMPSTTAVLPLVAERRPVWWMFGHLAPGMGLDVLGGADPDTLTDEQYLSGLLVRSPIPAEQVWAAGPHGCEVPVEHGWVVESLLPEGCWSIAPPLLLDRLRRRVPTQPAPLVLVPRREMAWSNSVAYAATDGPGEVRVCPADAAVFGLTDGTDVTVASDHGSCAATVRIDATLPTGVITSTHGRAASEVGALTSEAVGVDPDTTMPVASGVVVRVTSS